MASSADKGQCIGFVAANLACELGPDAEGVGDFDPKHCDPPNGCTVRRNFVPVDRQEGCATTLGTLCGPGDEQDDPRAQTHNPGDELDDAVAALVNLEVPADRSKYVYVLSA